MQNQTTAPEDALEDLKELLAGGALAKADGEKPNSEKPEGEDDPEKDPEPEDDPKKKDDDEYDAEYMKKHMRRFMKDNPVAEKKEASLKKAEDAAALLKAEALKVEGADGVTIDLANGTDLVAAATSLLKAVTDRLRQFDDVADRLTSLEKTQTEMFKLQKAEAKQAVDSGELLKAHFGQLGGSQPTTARRGVTAGAPAKTFDLKKARETLLKAHTEGDERATEAIEWIANGGLTSPLCPNDVKARIFQAGA